MEEILKNKFIKSNNFDDIYKSLIYDCYLYPDYIISPRDKETKEILNISFTLSNPLNNEVLSKSRNFKKDFAIKFFEWIKNGETDISKLYDVNDNARKYSDDIPDPVINNRNTSYGPRLNYALNFIIDELKRDPYSRRAIINILYHDDLEILKPSYDGLTKIEYPCTIALSFLIRDNKLNLSTMMRSQNIVTTICYDIFNFTKIQIMLLEKLKQNEQFQTLQLGEYNHFMVSAHIYAKEMQLAKKISEEYNLI